jgi:hypothetical protein
MLEKALQRRIRVVDKDAFADRGRSLEDEYFHRKEKEVIDKMRRKAAADAERQRLGEQAGVADDEVLRDLQELGYTAETVMLLHLVPLIQTAWAEGGITPKERDLVVQAARKRGVAAGSAADAQLSRWLEEKPSDQFFQSTLRMIRTILQAQSPEAREAGERDLLSLATAIASASGGIVGFRAVSDEERQILAHINDELKKGGKS